MTPAVAVAGASAGAARAAGASLLRHAFLALLGYVLPLLLYSAALVGPRAQQRQPQQQQQQQPPPLQPAQPCPRQPQPAPPPPQPPAALSCAAQRSRGLLEHALPPPRTAPWPHQLPDPACPIYIQNDVNGQAGLGHRLSNWLVALNTALHFNATFLHSFEEGTGVHGAYSGWEGALGLGAGGGGAPELTWRQAQARAAAAGAALREVALPHATFDAAKVREHHTYELAWGPLLHAPGACHTVFRIGGDSWPYDFTTRAKEVVLAKFAAAAAAAASAGAATPAAFSYAPAAPHWDAGAVNIAVHVRKGDVYTVPADMLARIVREAVLPALLGAGLPPHRIALHVFAEFAGYGGEAFPDLAALGGGEGPAVRFWEGASEWAAFVHLGLADFVVSSQSGFPSMATYFGAAPLALGFPSSNTLKHCRADIVCCYYDGRCPLSVHSRVAARAARLAAAEACGLLAARRGAA